MCHERWPTLSTLTARHAALGVSTLQAALHKHADETHGHNHAIETLSGSMSALMGLHVSFDRKRKRALDLECIWHGYGGATPGYGGATSGYGGATSGYGGATSAFTSKSPIASFRTNGNVFLLVAKSIGSIMQASSTSAFALHLRGATWAPPSPHEHVHLCSDNGICKPGQSEAGVEEQRRVFTRITAPSKEEGKVLCLSPLLSGPTRALASAWCRGVERCGSQSTPAGCGSLCEDQRTKS
eukprot:365678-Chlamydomonas_euryale.AAC.3